jgi:hypothetical protein
MYTATVCTNVGVKRVERSNTMDSMYLQRILIEQNIPDSGTETLLPKQLCRSN